MNIIQAMARTLQQLNNKQNKNAYGETVVVLDLEDDRRIDITHEKEGLTEKEEYYFLVFRCADIEYDAFADTNGIICERNTSSTDMTELFDTIQQFLDYDDEHTIEAAKEENGDKSVAKLPKSKGAKNVIEK